MTNCSRFFSARADEDSIASTPKRLLSAKHYDCENAENPVLEDCTLKRSVYQAWEVDDGDSIGGWMPRWM